MQKNKILTIIFVFLTLLTTHLACIIITHDFTQSYYTIKYAGTAIPAAFAFLWCIPFGFAFLLFATLAHRYYKKFKSQHELEPK